MGNCCQGMLSTCLPFFTGRNFHGGTESSGVTFHIVAEAEGEEGLLVGSLPPREGGTSFLFDVFLSFRGEDTRKGFTSSLCEALIAKGVRTFFDSETLAKGERVDKLFHYIQGSNIFVPIFSKRYADSKWCLKEIAEIMKCGRMIIPVFLDVEPTHVRHQTGHFESAFKWHICNASHDEVSEWRAALREAGEVSGFTPGDTAGYEAKLVQMITKRVLKELARPTFDVARFPVGLDDPMKDIMTLSDTQAKGVRMIGIYGVGGVGKTTLAKAICNKASPQFEASSFLSSIKDKEMIALQKQLLTDLFGDTDATINDADQGTALIKRRISSKTVLIILDDIDSEKQVRSLACCRDRLSVGSMVVLTTRAKDVLTLCGLQERETYELKELSSELSLQLFSYHAFGCQEPPQDFAQLSHRVVSFSGGLPLALEVYGSLFFDRRTREEWVSMLAKLESCQDKGIHERLKVSFDGLDEGEKEIFLDIACFFIGYEKEDLEYMWRDCGFYPDVALSVLQHRSLLKFTEEDGFKMHDQIRDMGRQIVINEDRKEPRLRSRLWKTEHITEALEYPQGASRTEAIVLPPSVVDNVKCFTTESFQNMERLRLLDANFATFQGEYKYLPRKLKWLEWHGCHLESLPSDLYLGNLVVLDLSYSKITSLWSQGRVMGMKALAKLKVLNLSHSEDLVILPDFSCMPGLEKLILDRCCKLVEVHESIGWLRSLVYLSMHGCYRVKLPDDLHQLTSLQHLNLCACRRLLTLSRWLGNSSSLNHLNISETRITSLPDMFNMENLFSLDLSCCESLENLPHSIGCLVNLKMLSVYRCCKLKDVPSSIGNLKNLRELNLGKTSIKEVPHWIGNLKDLRTLNLQETMVQQLPDSISNLENLQVLNLEGTTIYELGDSIGNLNNLTSLNLEGTRIQQLPASIGNLKNLLSLNLGKAEIQQLPDSIGNLKKLSELNLNETNIRELPDSLGSLEQLVELSLYGCENFESLPSSMMWTNLHLLDIRSTAIKQLPENIVSLNRLQELQLDGCQVLEFATWFPSSIIEASADDCPSLVEISGISKCTNLQKLQLADCEKLVELPPLENSNQLDCLSIVNCNRLGALPRLPPSLTTLSVSECTALATISDISNLKCLEELDLSGCKMLSHIPGLQNLSCLRDLVLEGCDGFKYPPELPSRLESLRATYCPSSGIITYITNVKTLRSLDLSGCKMHTITGLESLQGLESLKLRECYNLSVIAQLPSSLTHLHASGCHALEIILDVSNLKSLCRLKLSGCAKLYEIGGLEKLNCIQSLNLKACRSLSVNFLDRMLKESNFKGLYKFVVPGSPCQGNGGGPGLSFISHSNFIGSESNDDKTLDVNIHLGDSESDYWKKGHMHTQVVTTDGHCIFENTSKLMKLVEESGCFVERYHIRGLRQKGNFMVLVSFDLHLQLRGDLYNRGEITQLSLSISRTPNPSDSDASED